MSSAKTVWKKRKATPLFFEEDKAKTVDNVIIDGVGIFLRKQVAKDEHPAYWLCHYFLGQFMVYIQGDVAQTKEDLIRVVRAIKACGKMPDAKSHRLRVTSLEGKQFDICYRVGTRETRLKPIFVVTNSI